LHVTGLMPPAYQPRWQRFHPAATEIKERVKYEIPRSDSDCTECNGRLGSGTRQRLPTRG
jgi:hypothetical protein